MNFLERILKIFGLFAVIILFFSIQAFIGIAILSMMIVPLTLLYCKMSNRSYNSVLDSSETLYRLNKFGQWSILFVVGLAIFYITVFIIL
jgi:hypothetical protein